MGGGVFDFVVCTTKTNIFLTTPKRVYLEYFVRPSD